MYPKTLLISISIGITLLMTGCITPRPGSSRKPGPTGMAPAAGAGLGAVGGAIVGKQLGGKKGELIGAGAGALIGAIGTSTIQTVYNDQLDEAEETGARKERVKLQNQFWNSNSGVKTQGGGGSKNSSKLQYPPGVYDGVKYGPRVEEVPTPPGKTSS